MYIRNPPPPPPDLWHLYYKVNYIYIICIFLKPLIPFLAECYKWACYKCYKWACYKCYKWACYKCYKWACSKCYKWACYKCYKWALSAKLSFSRVYRVTHKE